MQLKLVSLLGLVVLVGLAWALSASRRRFPWRTVLTGLALQFGFAWFMLTTCALCGLANFSSIAIQIGGIGALVPERRADLAKLGLRAMVVGLIACYLTATVVGMLR